LDFKYLQMWTNLLHKILSLLRIHRNQVKNTLSIILPMRTKISSILNSNRNSSMMNTVSRYKTEKKTSTVIQYKAEIKTNTVNLIEARKNSTVTQYKAEIKTNTVNPIQARKNSTVNLVRVGKKNSTVNLDRVGKKNSTVNYSRAAQTHLNQCTSFMLSPLAARKATNL